MRPLLKPRASIRNQLLEISVGMRTGALSGSLHLIKLNKTLAEVRHKFGISQPLEIRKDCLNQFAYASLDSRLWIILPDTIEAYSQLTKGVCFLACKSHMNEAVYDE